MAPFHENLPFPHWENECHHIVFYKASAFTVGGGTTPPHSACPMHYHTKPTCVISTKDTSPVTIAELQPPNYDISNPKRAVCTISQGDCFTQAFPDTIVHSFISTEVPGAFIIIESSAPVMTRDSPFSQVHGGGVEVVRKQSHCFWSSQLLRIDPGASATINDSNEIKRKDVHRIGTVISRVEYTLNNLVFDGLSGEVQRYAQSAFGHCFEVAIVEEVQNTSGQFCIRNQGAEPWEGMLVELFEGNDA